ncbi:MAG TPA: sugar ABC transporter permease [Limnochordia bacterium]
MVALRRLLGWRAREVISAYLCISPWLIGFFAFLLFPLIYSIRLSFMEWNFMHSEWVGLGNYIRILTADREFWGSLNSTAYFSLISIPITVIFALLLAVLVNQRVPGIQLFRAIYFLPVIAASGVVAARIGPYVFEQGLDIQINYAVLGLDISGRLQETLDFFITLTMLGLWRVGIQMLIFLAGLQGISTTYYEAAEIDGASFWQKFWSITLPLLSPIILLNVILTIVESFTGVFTIANVLTRGRDSLFFMDYIDFRAFNRFELGYASALSWILFILVMGIILGIFRLSRHYVFYAGERS